MVGTVPAGGWWLNTGLYLGRVGLVAELHTSPPPVGEDWEEVVEVSFVPVLGLMLIDGCTRHHDVAEISRRAAERRRHSRLVNDNPDSVRPR